ncbi:THUMP domain-containing protein 2 isoform X2 [Onychomys torridus]|uniref:THUMP domain-containing protein 2 isoform X2 n=1 Tax=Onychomys torridus TaxID=38674 RepID=UPI00167F6107|nr:THUMP domain-containing protein 2 isoform X2 [Onychomys torridus]
MAAAGAEPGSDPAAAGGVRFFCTAGRGLEPFLMREVHARLEATQVEYISGKVFFTTCSDLSSMKKLKSAERLFLLIKKQLPIAAPSLRKGKILNEMQRLINDDPGSWLKATSLWKKLLEQDTKGEKVSQRNTNPLKRKVGEDEIVSAKKLKLEGIELAEESHREGQRDRLPEDSREQGDALTEADGLQEQGLQNDMAKAADTQSQEDLTFRVSCRCSGNMGKAFTAQDRLLSVLFGPTPVGGSMSAWVQQPASTRQPNEAEMSHPNWSHVARAEGVICSEIAVAFSMVFTCVTNTFIRNYFLECYVKKIFVHLSDAYSVVGIPLFRVPLASRTYIQTAGLRSTIAWAMASVAEIKAGALVLDPMCGLGTTLVEAAEEWPDVYYMGADVSDTQLRGAGDNLKAAGLTDKIDLLKASVTELPLPSQSVDVIISDIPFGKKFKLGKDIKSILQEMERVLCVGGAMVLLLSEDHHRHLRDCGGNSIPPTSQGNITDPEMRMLLNPDKRSGTSDTALPSQKAGSSQCPSRVVPCGSLVPVECFKVSLGKTDAFICKYKKAPASGLPPAGCHEPGAHPEMATLPESPSLQDSL